MIKADVFFGRYIEAFRVESVGLARDRTNVNVGFAFQRSSRLLGVLCSLYFAISFISLPFCLILLEIHRFQHFRT